ncbi:MAG: hypothetical protein AB1505_02595 [Candidatus Latescibacterota bacterium]
MAENSSPMAPRRTRDEADQPIGPGGSCLDLSSARRILGFVPRDHVSEHLQSLPPEVVARHAATVWQVRSQGTGCTLQQEPAQQPR